MKKGVQNLASDEHLIFPFHYFVTFVFIEISTKVQKHIQVKK